MDNEPWTMDKIKREEIREKERKIKISPVGGQARDRAGLKR